MIRNSKSRQTTSILRALLAARGGWRYGYELSRETAVKSGTLYPILMRLDAQGWLEAEWEESTLPGRPPRHLYRLTTSGQTEAERVVRESATPSPLPRRSSPAAKLGPETRESSA